MAQREAQTGKDKSFQMFLVIEKQDAQERMQMLILIPFKELKELKTAYCQCRPKTLKYCCSTSLVIHTS